MSHNAIDINIHRLFMNIQAQQANWDSRVVASLNIEKAFDMIEWPDPWEVLRRICLHLRFIQRLLTIYIYPVKSIQL